VALFRDLIREKEEEEVQLEVIPGAACPGEAWDSSLARSRYTYLFVIRSFSCSGQLSEGPEVPSPLWYRT
jgi:hypothetical protein